MKGLITTAVACAAAAGSVGCYGYRDIVDPCYPQRYNYAAGQEVKAALAPQVHNGHVLDQTVWNYHFEVGKATLTAGGTDVLARLARTRPAPDLVIYLQTAQDLTYDPEKPGNLVAERTKLDAERIQAVQAFLTAQTANRPLAFQVQVHDPAEVGIPATPVNNIVQGYYGSFKGALRAAGGASTTGGAGATAAPAAGR